jgi:TetR/AcrR family fatty acid metabolism transcriptional regulator
MTETTAGTGTTRERLVAVASDHLARHGLDGLRGPAVAVDAGVSEASVWHHLGSKTGLLVAVMQRYYDDLLEDASAVVEAASSPRERLERFARFWLRRMSDDVAIVGELQRWGRASHDPVAVEAFADCNRRVTRLFERILEDLVATGSVRGDVPTRVARDAFFGTAEHVVVGRAVTGRDGDLDDAADTLLDVLLHGVGAEADRTTTPSLATIDAKLDALLAGERPGGPDEGRE